MIESVCGKKHERGCYARDTYRCSIYGRRTGISSIRCEAEVRLHTICDFIAQVRVSRILCSSSGHIVRIYGFSRENLVEVFINSVSANILVTTLREQQTDNIPWWCRHIVSLVLLDLIQVFLEISLSRLHKMRLVHKFPANIKDWEDTDHGVAEQESRNIPRTWKEDGVATDEGHDEAHDQSVVCAPWLPEGLVWEGVTADSLCFEGLLEF